MSSSMFFEEKHIADSKAPEPVSRFARVFFDGTTIPDAPLSMASFRFESEQYGPMHTRKNSGNILRPEGQGACGH